MFPRQFVGPVERKEPLRVICIALRVVGHSEQASTVKLESTMDFILEWLSVDAFSALTGTGRITTLDNEAWNDSVKDDSVVVACG